MTEICSGNILVLSSWSSDEPLIQSYLLPNLEIMRGILPEETRIILQTAEKKISHREKSFEIQLEKLSIEWLPLAYTPFSLRAIFGYVKQFFRLKKFITKNGITQLHAFAPPAGAMALLLHKPSRTRLIIDSWEPHADCMAETGTWKKNSKAYRILFNAEKRQAQSANVLIAASHSMLQYAEQKFGKVTAAIKYRPAWVNTEIFRRSEESRTRLRHQSGWDDKVVCVCLSKLGGLYLKEDVFRIINAGTSVFGNSFHFLLISANEPVEVKSLSEQFNISASTITHKKLQHAEIPEWLSACDFALNPQQPVPSKKHGTPVKDGEYWAMGLPLMILPEISEDSEIVVKENVGVVIPTLLDKDLIESMSKMKSLIESDRDVNGRSVQVAMKYRNKSLAEKAYMEIYGVKKN